jgi:hypothetical protein
VSILLSVSEKALLVHQHENLLTDDWGGYDRVMLEELEHWQRRHPKAEANEWHPPSTKWAVASQTEQIRQFLADNENVNVFGDQQF